MPTITKAQKAGIAARVASRMAGDKLNRNPWWRGAVAGGKTMFATLGRIFHMLFLEVTGLFFVILAFMFGRFLMNENAKRLAGHGDPLRFWLAVGLSVLFVWFAVTSFRRARKKR